MRSDPPVGLGLERPAYQHWATDQEESPLMNEMAEVC